MNVPSNGQSPTSIVRHEERAALVEARYEGLSMAFAPAEALRRMQELQGFIKEVMEQDLDFGTIPGTEKPTLYKPGAEKLAEVYGFAWRFEDDGSIQDWDRGFFNFRKKCVLTSRADSRYVGDGVGSCNSRESKYAGRWVAEAEVPAYHDKSKLRCKPGVDWKFENEVPVGVDKRTLKTKEITSKKSGKKYKMFGIEANLYQIPNDDIFSLVNTMEKMACKRAFVGAIVAATRSSGIFSQDIEDLPDEVIGKAESRRSWERDPEPADDDVSAPTATQAARAKADSKPAGELALLIAEVKLCKTNEEIREHGRAQKARIDGLSDPDFEKFDAERNLHADELEAAAAAAGKVKV